MAVLLLLLKYVVFSCLANSCEKDNKKLITSAPILASPDNEHPFRIEANSSDFATGAVLSQQSLDSEKWHPVAFLSKSLSAVE